MNAENRALKVGLDNDRFSLKSQLSSIFQPQNRPPPANIAKNKTTGCSVNTSSLIKTMPGLRDNKLT